MTATAESEAQATAGEIVQYAVGTVEEYRPRIVMSPEDARALDDRLREGMKAILRENVDYGPIPGGDKDRKNLLKPGAEKLLQWFGFGQRSIEVKTERDDPEHPSGIADKARRIGVTYRTEVVKTIPGHGEVVVATCEGYAGFDEDRYYQDAASAQAKAKSKEEMWARKDERPPNARKWQFITDDYRAPWNTVVKMAQKRAFVGAAILATGSSGLFTQDMEDAPGAPAGDAIAAPARALVGTLPEEVQNALNRWWQQKGWPAPGKWDAEQWCAALAEAGRLDSRHALAGQIASQAPGHAQAIRAQVNEMGNGANGSQHEDPRTAQPDPDDWLRTAIEKASALTDVNALRGLFRDAGAKARAGTIPVQMAKQVQEMVAGRVEELKAAPVEGTVVDSPAAGNPDPWMLKVEEIATAEDAAAVREELDKQHKGGVIDSRRANAVRAAIRTKAASLPREGATA